MCYDSRMRVSRWFAILLLMPPAAAPAQGLPSERKASDLVIEAEIPIPGDTMAFKDVLGFGFETLWLASGESLVRVDPADNSLIEIVLDGANGSFRDPAAGEGAVWFANVEADLIYRVDPASNAVTLTIPAKMFDWQGSIAAGEGSVWVVTAGEKPDSVLTRFDPADGSPTAQIALPAPGAGVAIAGGAVWVTSPFSGLLFRIDPATNSVTGAFRIGGSPRFIVPGEGALWILDPRSAVHRVDPASGALTATIPLGVQWATHGDIAVGGGFVWASVWGAPVIQIDPGTGRLLARYVGGPDFADTLRYGAGSLWISGPKIFRIAPPSAP